MSVRIATTPDERRACFAIRHTVFVLEQGVPEDEELDAHEDEATHFLALDKAGKPVGTARLWVTPDGEAKAQRVAVLEETRGTGVGVAIMEALEAEAKRKGFRALHLAAQVSALSFYERLGYEAEGDRFWDAGILHRMMHKPLDS